MERRDKLAVTVVDEEVDTILDLVGKIGIALASRK